MFKSKGVPVVPSLGNNDIWREFPTAKLHRQYSSSQICPDHLTPSKAHNILYPGPNAITNEFLESVPPLCPNPSLISRSII